MRITEGKSTTTEASFKVEKNTNSDIDEIEANFVRRLKKGLGKYKGKLPLKQKQNKIKENKTKTVTAQV
jgi:hypothetical protein